jgi:putative SOS response-associated peptidase YedK
MCGRYTLRASSQDLVKQFRLFEAVEFPPRYNIAPTQPVPVIRRTDAGRRLELLRWGLVPAWAEDVSIGYRLINARAETAATRPAFRAAFRQRRCLMPADGFFEWQKVGGKKTPFYIRRCDGAPFAFAALWERWLGPEEQHIESCALLTTDANDRVRPIHDRMPVILSPESYDRWLDPSIQDAGALMELLQPCPAEEITAYRVSTYVNNARHEGPQCIEPYEG